MKKKRLSKQQTASMNMARKSSKKRGVTPTSNSPFQSLGKDSNKGTSRFAPMVKQGVRVTGKGLLKKAMGVMAKSRKAK